MSERILPGVTISEVTEGLIAPRLPGSVNCKLVGTACKGPMTPQFFGADEHDKFRDTYGPSDPYQMAAQAGTNPAEELSLRRAGDLMFAGMSLQAGAGGVWACRVGGATPVQSVLAGINHDGAATELVLMTAVEPGAWYNNVKYKHMVNKDADGGTYNGNNIFTLELPSNDKFDSENDTTNNRSNYQFYAGDEYVLEYQSATAGTTAVIGDFIDAWNASAGSRWFLASTTNASSTGTYTEQVAATYVSEETYSTPGTNWSANDQAVSGATANAAALDEMRGYDARLSVIAGADESSMVTEGRTHVGNESGNQREQVFICGVAANTNQDTLVTSAITASGLNFQDERVVKVVPGIKLNNPYESNTATEWVDNAVTSDTQVTLPGSYAAAHVAGLMACWIPDQSPMNKSISYPTLEHNFTRANKKKLVTNDFFVLVGTPSAKTLRDLTTAGNASAFYHVSTRVVVDEIKMAMRSAGNPFIGLKNIPRIRATLTKNLEYVLQEYTRREIINGNWQLSVTASRTEQILGVVTVVMVIQTVFFIEFIEVTLVLE